VLGNLPVSSDPRVLVDYRTADDAGVYKFDEQRALVQTVDFFTPIVDDPVVYGRIAAANALSDVYAMGGRPLTALAIAAFPNDGDPEVLGQIFGGGLQTLQESDVALLGGHTVQDQEIKFGYAVTGEVDPRRMWTNAGARPGDRLLLTKPLGTGVIATAIKFNRAPEDVARAAIASMLRTNRSAAQAIASLPHDAVHACTDITGFGLVGHVVEMATASRCTLVLDIECVPLLEGALDLVERNTPGGARTNREHFASAVGHADTAIVHRDPRREQLLYDPQTSGGLLVAVAEGAVPDALDQLKKHGTEAVVVGRAEPTSSVLLRLHSGQP
jgi:selenide,water dikinase